MKQMFLAVTGLCLLILSGGCQAVFNPYDDAFQCPEMDEGACTSIPDAYQQSLTNGSPKDGCDTCSEKAAMPEGNTAEPPPPDARSIYQEKRFERFKSLIQADRPPVAAPPEVVRVLVLSYTGQENELFGFRYIYFFATEPSWLLSTGMETGQGED
ncbi:MAG: TraV family lipoprotein [Thermodesulfobacteriota bacterium]